MIYGPSVLVQENGYITSDKQTRQATPSLLYEMMRSFSALAHSLNLSQAVEELGSTRQTVRRHIAQLEEAMGCKLFDVQQRRYMLTEKGASVLGPAKVLLDQGKVWYEGHFDTAGGMLRFSDEGEGGLEYHLQQQPISEAWRCDRGLIRSSLKAWTLAEGSLESEHMANVRPCFLVFREYSEGWLCVEVGEASYFSNLYGWVQARSSVGRTLDQFPGGRELASLFNLPFQDVSTSHGMRIDQVVTRLRLNSEGPLDYLAYNRLLLGVRMPDGSPALVSVVERTDKIKIEGLSQDILEEVPQKARSLFEE